MTSPPSFPIKYIFLSTFHIVLQKKTKTDIPLRQISLLKFAKLSPSNRNFSQRRKKNVEEKEKSGKHSFFAYG